MDWENHQKNQLFHLYFQIFVDFQKPNTQKKTLKEEQKSEFVKPFYSEFGCTLEVIYNNMQL